MLFQHWGKVWLNLLSFWYMGKNILACLHFFQPITNLLASTIHIMQRLFPCKKVLGKLVLEKHLHMGRYALALNVAKYLQKIFACFIAQMSSFFKLPFFSVLVASSKIVVFFT